MTPYWVLASGFALVVAAMAVVELSARLGRARCRTVGEALHAGLLARVGGWAGAGRWLVMLAWLWTGFHLLAR